MLFSGTGHTQRLWNPEEKSKSSYAGRASLLEISAGALLTLLVILTVSSSSSAQTEVHTTKPTLPQSATDKRNGKSKPNRMAHYTVRVTVRDPQGVPVEDATVKSNVASEVKKVAGEWIFEISKAKIPQDRRIKFFATKDDARLSGELDLQLGKNPTPKITIKLVAPPAPTPKWPMVGDDDVDRVRKRLNDLENRPSAMTEYELARELKQLFNRPGYSYVGEESPERFLFALCTTRPILQYYVSEFKSSPQVRLAVQTSVQKMILLRDQIAEIYGNVFKQNVEDYCERHREWQSFRKQMPSRLIDTPNPAYINKTCGTLRDLSSALLSAGLVDSDAACPNIKIPIAGAAPNEPARSSHSLSLYVDEITVLDNGEEVNVHWTFDIYLGDKNSERLASQIEKREYNLKNNQLPYPDKNPPQKNWDVTIQGDAVLIRVEARRNRTNVVLFGKQPINLNDDLNRKIPVPVNALVSTPEGRSLGQFTAIVIIKSKY